MNIKGDAVMICPMICPPMSPTQILETTGRDVFEESIGLLSYTPNPDIVPGLVKKAWQRWRFRGIGDYDRERWFLIFNDSVQFEWEWYRRALDLILSDAMTSLPESRTVEIISENALTEVEDMPDTATGDTKYLSDRSNSTRDGTVTTTARLGMNDDATTIITIARRLREAEEIFFHRLDDLFINRW